MKLENTDILSFLYKDKEGNEISSNIPISKVVDWLEEEAYEILTTPDCTSSTCAMNNFCECDPCFEGFEFSHVEFYKIRKRK